MPRPTIGELVAREDHAALVAAARERLGRVLRYLTSRLYTDDATEKARVVAALGAVFAADGVVSPRRAADTLRRFFWAMNDESGAVPYGVPEAIGAILVARPALQAEYLPILCSMVTHADMVQTGPIERGVYWALGRIGPPVAEVSATAVQGLAHAARNHEDPETRRVAAEALQRIQPPPVQRLG
jgi:hypothetical protein